MSARAIKNILVTGGAGFMGSAFVRYLLKQTDIEKVIVLDCLTYAGNLENLREGLEDQRCSFVHGDILNAPLVEELVLKYHIDAIAHFAAESHVDRSIEDPKIFLRTNVEGTMGLLEVVRRYPKLHFHHVSTDEVFGSLYEGVFFEDSPYSPNSPYAASKAASDHFVRAYAKTYGISTTLSHASNNYGPGQYREKFIPVVISSCFKRQCIPIYGDGENVRTWLFVDDHSDAVWRIMSGGSKGASYNIGGDFQTKNIDLLRLLLKKIAKTSHQSIDELEPLIEFVPDRLGHDFRYALSSDKLKNELGWTARISFEEGIEKTVAYYAKG